MVRWETDALDQVRPAAWNEACGAVGRQGRTGQWTRQGVEACPLRAVEDPENLTSRQQAKLAWVAKTDPGLHRAYLLKEGLRLVFQLGYDEAVEALEAWIG